MAAQLDEKVEQLVDYVMKWCLWQFNSRAWDRENQNNNIIPKATQILCGETPKHDSPADQCYWVEAAVLAKDFKEAFSWLGRMSKDDIATLMDAFKARIDYLTITGSLNAEIHNPQY
jgi:Fe-only nitrogenase, delta subunit